MREKHGIMPKQFSADILATIGRISGEVLAEVAARDELSRRVYDSFMQARRGAIAWAKVSQEAFTSARGLDFEY